MSPALKMLNADWQPSQLIVHDSTWSLSCTEHMQSQLLRVALVAQHEHPAVFADLGPPHACGECSKAAGHRMFICHDFFLNAQQVVNHALLYTCTYTHKDRRKSVYAHKIYRG